MPIQSATLKLKPKNPAPKESKKHQSRTINHAIDADNNRLNSDIPNFSFEGEAMSETKNQMDSCQRGDTTSEIIVNNWKMRQKWLKGNGFAYELEEIAHSLFMIKYMIGHRDFNDEYTSEGVRILLETVSTRVLDMSQGRLSVEKLPD